MNSLRPSCLSPSGLCLCVFLVPFLVSPSARLRAAETDEAEAWDIEAPLGPVVTQKLDVDEGTWMNLDVSPNGKWIVFDLLGDIYRMPIQGSDKPIKLTSGVAWDMQPRFSPDGNWIAFTSDRKGANDKSGDNIWVMTLDGKSVTQVTNESYRLLNGPAWSPDGQYIVARKHFTSRRSLGAGEMWMYHRNAATTKAMAGVQLTTRPTDQKDVNEPIFSPDGLHLYYSEDVWPGTSFEYDKDSNKQIYVVKQLNLKTGETETLISGPGGACRPTPSHDGRWIAFVRRVGAKTGLHVFDTQSGAVRLVYDQLERDMQETWAIHGVYPTFAWTPQDESIVIWAKGKIRRIEIASGKARVIPFRVRDTRRATEAVRFPIEAAPDEFDVRVLQHCQVTPDGSQVVFQALGRVFVRDLNDLDKPPRTLTQPEKHDNHFEFMPSVSRDGRYVTYVRWNDEQLGSIRVASLDPEADEHWAVTQKPGHYANPVFSPDGETIVFEKGGGGMLTSPLWSHETGIYQAPAKGGEMKRIIKSGRSVRFGSDASRVFYLKGKREKDADNLGLHSVDLDGANSREHYRSRWATDYVLSPDGKWIAFVERYHVYVAPMVDSGRVIEIGPLGGNNKLPMVQASKEAGQWLQFAADSSKLYWTLGPDLYTFDLHEANVTAAPLQAKKRGKRKARAKRANRANPRVTPIGFRLPHAQPNGVLAIVGARIVTMEKSQVIEDGVVVIEGNRIVAVGPRDEVKVPPEAKVIEAQGRTLLPGFIDTHAHGPQASGGIVPQRNWVDYARLAFGVTTIHDPSNDTNAIFSASEMTKAGRITAPRTFSTGKILYGATGSFKAEIDSLDDARFHLRRLKAVGAFTVKSYNQPRRDQRQMILQAARELKMMVVPEGGATFMHNMNMIVDGHTGIEHTLPVQTAYDDVFSLWAGTKVGYTPTLCVAYGGISGEQYFYQKDDLYLHPRLKSFIPPHVLQPRARRRDMAPDEDYNHIRVAEIAKHRVDAGGLVQAGGHGQLNGICTHWEMWSFVLGGMTPEQSLECGTIHGARYLGLDADLGSIKSGKLADLILLERGRDPLKNIRDTEHVEWVIANGRVFDARRMNRWGSPSPQPPFYWAAPGYGGVSATLPRVHSCGCQRPNALNWPRP